MTLRGKLATVLLLVLALAVAVWWFLPRITEVIALTIAARLGASDAAIEIESIGSRATTIARARVAISTDYGPVTAELRNLIVEYDPLAQRLIAATASRATISWQQQAAPARARGTEPVFPLSPLPIERVQIDELNIALHTTVGDSLIQGKLSAETTADTIQIQIADRRQRLSVLADYALSHIEGSLEHDNSPIAEISLTTPLGDDTRFRLRAKVAGLMRWTDAADVVPESVRAWIADYAIDDGELAARGRRLRERDRETWDVDANARWEHFTGPGFRADGTLAARVTGQWPEWRAELTDPARFELQSTDAALEPGDLSGIAVRTTAPYTVELVLGSTEQFQAIGRGTAATTATLKNGERLSGSLRGWHVHTPSTGTHAPGSGAVAGEFELTDVDLGPIALRAARLRISGDLALTGAPGGGQWSASGATTYVWPEKLAGVALQGDWRMTDQDIVALGDALIGDAPVAVWRADHRFDRGTGKLEAKISAPVPAIYAWLRPALDAWSKEVTLDGGQLSGTTALSWEPQRLSSHGEAEIIDLAGKWEKAEFHGVNISLRSDDLFAPTVSLSATADSATTASGVPLANARVNASIDPNVVDISEIRFEALGGSFRLEPARLSLSGGAFPLRLHVDGLDFSLLLRQLDQPALSGSGRLSGVVPLEIGDAGVTIPNAEFTSLGPGTLRYRPEPGGGGPQMDNIALQALQDFHYESLRADAKYTEDGNLLVRARMVGKNPDLYGGASIALNPNITYLLPGLIRATLVTGFEREIMRQLQEQSAPQGNGVQSQ